MEDLDASLAHEYVACHYVNSRGINYACDLVIKSERDVRAAVATGECYALRPGAVIFVKIDFFSVFVKVLFPILRTHFVLVTGNSDLSLPNDVFSSAREFAEFADRERIIHWFAQNCTEFHAKVTCIPIGIDYHSLTDSRAVALLGWSARAMSPLEQDAMLWTMATSAPPLETRTRRCYVNFQFTMNTRFGQSHRRSALAEIPRELLELEPEPTDRATTWMHQRQFAFVVCPYGNGLDTHRVWEALALGCIAIVKPGPFASMYQGLRVLCVRRWSDVTPELLDQAAESFARVGAGLLENGFDSIKVASPLSLRFWTDKFREAGNAAVDEAVGGGWFG